MDIAKMNEQAQETAQQMKQMFPEMTDAQIITVTRFIVLSSNLPLTQSARSRVFRRYPEVAPIVAVDGFDLEARQTVLGG